VIKTYCQTDEEISVRLAYFCLKFIKLMPNTISLEVYHGVEATVNAYIFSDDTSIVLADCLRNSNEAAKLAQQIKEQGKPLTHLLITHGHPDHYLGMNIMKQEFPDVNIVVASQEIKDDIAGFSAWMETVGWLDGEPAMKPKSETNPNGFDYQQNISVLTGNELKLAGGAVLELKSDYSGAECEHLTTVFSKDLNAFLANDFCYSGVHPWLAIDKNNIENWKKQLEEFKTIFSESKPAVYPGHGKPADVSMFSDMLNYIRDFQKVVAEAKTREEAMTKMQELYPAHLQADFLLVYSVNAFVGE
jgi:glyoxylase-like metal-dependent hydrolase (beta-lactamase superfamily II)